MTEQSNEELSLPTLSLAELSERCNPRQVQIIINLVAKGHEIIAYGFSEFFSVFSVYPKGRLDIQDFLAMVQEFPKSVIALYLPNSTTDRRV